MVSMPRLKFGFILRRSNEAHLQFLCRSTLARHIRSWSYRGARPASEEHL